MHWKKLLAPAVIAVAVTLGAGSVATASSIPGFGGATRYVAQEATSTPTSTPTPKVTDPAVACADVSVDPALATLCPLWQGATLPERAQQMLGSLILHVVNGDSGTPHRDGEHSPQDPAARQAKLQASCEQYMAAHPDATDPHATFCTAVLAGETPAFPGRADPSGAGKGHHFGPQGHHRGPRADGTSGGSNS
jgi:hypothetical protein